MPQVDTSSKREALELARFVAAAQARRGGSWIYVERLKALCAQTAPSVPELRPLAERLSRLEAEVQNLRLEGEYERLLRDDRPHAPPVPPQGFRCLATSAANADSYSSQDWEI